MPHCLPSLEDCEEIANTELLITFTVFSNQSQFHGRRVVLYPHNCFAQTIRMPPRSSTMYDPEESVLSDVSTEQTKKTKKTVRIQTEKNHVFPVPHIDDMSDAEVATIWYDRPDYDAMKQSFIPIIKKLMRGAKVEESDSETARGLEFRTKEGALRRQHNKVQSIQCVLDEQDRQLALGIHDVDKIADIYVEASKHCLLAAQDLGEMDYEFVQSNISSGSGDEKPKKMGGLRKMIRQVRRTSLTWKSSRSLSSDKDANPASE